MHAELIYCIIVILLVMLLMIHNVSCRDQYKSCGEIIRKPFKYIIDIIDDSITVYELDKGSTEACRHREHYYNSYLFIGNDTELISNVPVSKEKNADFIYTDDVVEVTNILKQKDKLLDWFMTRINV